MKRVLLTNSMGPYALGWGEDQFDLFGARLTRGQGPFTLRGFLHAWALYIIAENIPAYTTVLECPDEKVFIKELKKGYDYIGIQIKSIHMLNIKKMVKLAREIAPASKIVLGGYGVAGLYDPLPHDPENCAGYLLDNTDHICREEGVSFFRKLLGADPGEPITQNYMPLAGVTLPGLEDVVCFRLTSTLVALGCPNACEFCNTSAFFKAKKIIISTPEQTCEYLKSSYERMGSDLNLFDVIWDEDFLLDRDYVMRLAELLQENNLVGKVYFFCFASIKALSQYTPEELALAGVGAVWIGFESKFDEVFTSDHNLTKRDGRDIKEVFNDLHRHGILIIASNILGFDFHTKENLKEDIDYFVSIKPDMYQVSPLTPCPGTALYGRMKEAGRIYDDFTWEHVNLWKDDVLQFTNFGKNEIKEYYDYAHKQLYEKNGPTILNLMDIMIQGHRTMVHSINPHLQSRSERCYFFAKKLTAAVLYTIGKLSPGEEVTGRVEEIEAKYKQYIGNFSWFEKLESRVVYLILKYAYKLRQSKEKVSDPPYRITQYYGDHSKPVVTKRRNPVRHFIRNTMISIVAPIIGLKDKPIYDIRLKDIDDFPVEFKTIEIEGNLMNYVDEGEGETLLMLHGNPTWSYLYRHFIKELKKDSRCVALDHLGYGLSDKPPNGDYSMEAHIRRLGKFIDEMNLKNITLICQDWGGIIGLSYAANNKERFKKLIPMNTTGFLPEKIGEFIKCAKAWGFPFLWSFKIPLLGKKMGMDWNVFLKLGMWMAIHNRKRQLHKKARLGYLYPFQLTKDRTAILKSVRQVSLLPGGPIWKLLKRTGELLKGWDIRTQIIWGMKDPVFVPWFADKFEEVLPNHAETLKIPTASHFLQDDEPGIIIEKIKKFLAEDGTPNVSSDKMRRAETA